MRGLQTFIYTRKFFRTQKRDSIIAIGMAVVIFLLVLIITKKNMFESYSGTRSGFFSVVSACIWIGIFNSIQLVCREKNDIVKDELDKGLHASSYIGAHFIYQFFLCLIQSIIIILLCIIIVPEYRDNGVLLPSIMEYFVTLFLIVFASDAIALVISSIVPNPVVAMTVMPLVLILQLVMAGVIFELEGGSKIISFFTISRWGMGAMGAIGHLLGQPNPIYAPLESMDGYSPYNTEMVGDLPKYVHGYMPLKLIEPSDSAYESNVGNLLLCWGLLILFIAVSFFASVVALKMTTKRLKK